VDTLGFERASNFNEFFVLSGLDELSSSSSCVPSQGQRNINQIIKFAEIRKNKKKEGKKNLVSVCVRERDLMQISLCLSLLF